ncbi:hypothetical protein PWP93_34705 [Paraburkholderia sp. A1RI-2L]|uniref:hypothetical protein n=1 Tax=Paraburkholderia sp. A1RI-2L TaxID=3028367 RepID=UPI003B76276C
MSVVIVMITTANLVVALAVIVCVIIAVVVAACPAMVMAVTARLARIRARVIAAARGLLVPRLIEQHRRFRRARRRRAPPVFARPQTLCEHQPRPESQDHG